MPVTVALNCSVPWVTAEAEPGEMATETAALVTPLNIEHAVKDKDRKNSENLTDKYFKKFLL